MVATVLRNLSDHHPGVRAMFPEDTAHLHRRFFDTLSQVVKYVDRFHKIQEPLYELGKLAAAHGANSGHYRIIKAELLRVMADLAGDDWTPGLSGHWAEALDAMIGAMLAGAITEEVRKAA